MCSLRTNAYRPRDIDHRQFGERTLATALLSLDSHVVARREYIERLDLTNQLATSLTEGSNAKTC